CPSAVLICTSMLVLVVVLITVVLQKYSDSFTGTTFLMNQVFIVLLTCSFKAALCDFNISLTPVFPADWRRSLSEEKNCPGDHFSFLIRSGAANVVPPKIFINNAGYGINVVILNGKTGEVIKTGHFDMYSGMKPLIELLKSIEKGSIVLMASYDEPSSKLTEDARKLIAELGSSVVQSLGFRDNWVFVGGKGATVKSNFEKYLKNDNMKNKYENWPELIELTGCIPKYLD
uniref:ILEI/PANDER domain-containing protein n=1 Tax=Lates calcarifer TaxID=8187 RepID=A0A4W6BPM5_LATCA